MKEDDLKHLSAKDREAVESLCEFIRAKFDPGDNGRSPDEVLVYTHYDNDDHKIGLRVGEISLVWHHGSGGMGGCSYQRSNPDSGQAILAAEEYLLNFYEKPWRPEGWESDLDLKADAEWLVEQAINDFEEAADAR